MVIMYHRHLHVQSPSGDMYDTLQRNDASFAKFLGMPLSFVQDKPRYVDVTIAYRFLSGRVVYVRKKKWLKKSNK